MFSNFFFKIWTSKIIGLYQIIKKIKIKKEKNGDAILDLNQLFGRTRKYLFNGTLTNPFGIFQSKRAYRNCH